MMLQAARWCFLLCCLAVAVEAGDIVIARRCYQTRYAEIEDRENVLVREKEVIDCKDSMKFCFSATMDVKGKQRGTYHVRDCFPEDDEAKCKELLEDTDDLVDVELSNIKCGLCDTDLCNTDKAAKKVAEKSDEDESDATAIDGRIYSLGFILISLIIVFA